MSHEPASVPCLPQIGALLELDSSLAQPNANRGNRHWCLVGSCVLVGNDRVLTIEHVLLHASRTMAAFFPYEGFRFVDLSRAIGRSYTRGDDLVALGLDGNLRFAAPLGLRKIRKVEKEGRWAYVGGYGAWRGMADGGLHSLQRVVQVTTTVPSGAPRCDNLDVRWYPSLNGGKQAGNFNSGGPVMWRSRTRGYEVIGINREIADEAAIGSWIGWDRYRWLTGLLGTPSSVMAPIARVCLDLEIERAGECVTIDLPPEATAARLTLNASGGGVLQMSVAAGPGVNRPSLYAKAASTADCAGRFLARSIEGIEAGPLTVAVAHLDGLPFPREPIRAQLCVLFHGSAV